jgi:uncharacterized peroxidase-related enzyme
VIRLEVVRRGHALKHKLMLGVGKLVLGAEPPDIMRILFHRYRFFGKPVGLLTHAVLRGPSDWTVGERELLATYVSAKNRCRFCTGAHAAVAGRAIGEGVVAEVLANGDSPSLSPKARAVLPFVAKLTAEPEKVALADLETLRRAGVSDDGILDAAYVVMLFCMYNRIVDAVGCEPLDPKQLVVASKMLLEKGYDL